MTGPAVMESRRSPLFEVAQRHEQDCWDMLNRHTAACPACLAERKLIGQNGFGCDTGRVFRVEWLAAARRRYELSPAKRQEG